MKKKIFITAILCSILLSGCYNYKDMNRLLFSTLAVADTDDEGQIYVYRELFKAYRGEGEKAGQEKRIVFDGKGKNAFEAFSYLLLSSNFPIEYSENKALVVTKKIAERGIQDLLDATLRDQKPSLRQYFFVFDGDAEELLGLKIEGEQFIGLFLYELMNTQDKSISVVSTKFHQLILDNNTGSKINVIPMIKLDKIGKNKEEGGQQENNAQSSRDQNKENIGQSKGEQSPEQDKQKEKEGSSSGQSGENKAIFQPHIIIKGAAVFVENKMEVALSKEGLEAYNLFKKNIKSGLISAPNPNFNGKLVSFNVMNNNSKKSLKLVDNKIQMKYTIKTHVVLTEAQDGITIEDKQSKEMLVKNLETVIHDRTIELFEKMKALDIDILDIKRDLEIKYPNAEIEDPLEATSLEVEVKVILDGSGIIKDSKY